MISVVNQYILGFDLGGNTDFIKKSELNEFTLIEAAGNILPTFELEFNTDDEKILPKLNELSELKVILGADRDSAFDIPLSISSFTQVENGRKSVALNIKGFYNALDYITKPVLKITKKVSGVEAIKEVVSNDFKPDFNVEKSSDKQNWIQYNISNKKFVADTILHSFNKDSFFLSAITVEGTFRLRDVKKDLDRDYDYRLIMQPKKQNDIVYDNNPTVVSNTGFLNNWMGYGREVFEQNLEEGKINKFVEQPEPILALTKKLARTETVRYGGTNVLNENVHKNYWKAYWNNLSNIVSLGNIDIIVTIDDYFYPIHPLDLIMLNMPSKEANYSSEYLSGLYYVSKVSRTWSNSKFSTTLVLNRESINQIS